MQWIKFFFAHETVKLSQSCDGRSGSGRVFVHKFTVKTKPFFFVRFNGKLRGRLCIRYVNAV